MLIKTTDRVLSLGASVVTGRQIRLILDSLEMRIEVERSLAGRAERDGEPNRAQRLREESDELAAVAELFR